MSADYKQLEEFRRKLQELEQSKIDKFMDSCCKEIAARLLAEVVKRTPVGDYSGQEYNCKQRVSTGSFHHKGHKDAKTGGTLRRSWSIKEIRREGDNYVIDIINPVEYVPYVEHGHRTRNGGWVEGHRMLTVSVDEVKKSAPGILEKKLLKLMKEVFNS